MLQLYFDQDAKIVDTSSAEGLPTLSDTSSATTMFPLVELLTGEAFPYKRGDFPRRHAAEWQTESLIETGKLVLRDLAELEPPADFSRRVAERLHILGLFPDPHNYFGKVGRIATFSEFKRQIGVEEMRIARNNPRSLNAKYTGLSGAELTDLLLSNYNELVEFPNGKRFKGPFTTAIITAMNQIGMAPSGDFIIRRHGGYQCPQ